MKQFDTTLWWTSMLRTGSQDSAHKSRVQVDVELESTKSFIVLSRLTKIFLAHFETCKTRINETWRHASQVGHECSNNFLLLADLFQRQSGDFVVTNIFRSSSKRHWSMVVTSEVSPTSLANASNTGNPSSSCKKRSAANNNCIALSIWGTFRLRQEYPNLLAAALVRGPRAIMASMPPTFNKTHTKSKENTFSKRAPKSCW